MRHDPAAASGPALPPASGILRYLLLLIAAAFVFGVWPQLDLVVTYFARELNGDAFQPVQGSWDWTYYGTRPFFHWLCALIGLLGLASLLLRRPIGFLTPRKAVFMLLAFGLTQGLIVDLYLKDVFGRARPRDLYQFGGDSVFTPFYTVSDQCSSNCSFVSGHAAMIFALFAFSFVVPRSWRRGAFWFALIAGSLAGWARIVQGAHFVSDIVFAGLVTYGATWLLAFVVLDRKAGRAWLDRRGFRRRRAAA